MQHGFKGNKEIPYESITSIQLRKASSMTRGYIQFGQSGFSESDDGLMDAVSDENTVLFDKDSLHDFEALRAKIRELRKTLKRRPERWMERWKSFVNGMLPGRSTKRSTRLGKRFSRKTDQALF
jgi:hypothetical protein